MYCDHVFKTKSYLPPGFDAVNTKLFLYCQSFDGQPVMFLNRDLPPGNKLQPKLSKAYYKTRHFVQGVSLEDPRHLTNADAMLCFIHAAFRKNDPSIVRFVCIENPMNKVSEIKSLVHFCQKWSVESLDIAIENVSVYTMQLLYDMLTNDSALETLCLSLDKDIGGKKCIETVKRLLTLASSKLATLELNVSYSIDKFLLSCLFPSQSSLHKLYLSMPNQKLETDWDKQFVHLIKSGYLANLKILKLRLANISLMVVETILCNLPNLEFLHVGVVFESQTITQPFLKKLTERSCTLKAAVLQCYAASTFYLVQCWLKQNMSLLDFVYLTCEQDQKLKVSYNSF